LNNFGEGYGDGIDGEVALVQVFCNGIAFELGNIEDGFMFGLLDNNATGFFMEVDVVAGKLIGKGAC